MPSVASAQEGLTNCAGQRIVGIRVRTQPPIFDSRAARIPAVKAAQRALHRTTRPAVIRNFLLLREGDPCDEQRRVESERILRAQPYLAEARILVEDAGGMTVVLDVQVVDEVATVAALRVSRAPILRRVRAGSQNVGGYGFYFSGEWQDGLAYRDGVAGRLMTSQLFGMPLQLTLTGARRPLGGEWLTGIRQPFLTEFQRFAWDASLGMRASYLGYRRADGAPIALRTDRRYGAVGFLTRVGSPAAFALTGSALSYEREETERAPVFILDTGLVATSDPVLDGRYGEHRMARLNYLLGFRRIQYLRVTGFDALEGPQDLWRGFQVGTLVGKGIRRLFGTDRDDMFFTVDAYAGGGTPRSFLASRVQVEARRDQETGMWDRGLGSGSMAWYRRWGPLGTTIAGARWSGGWRSAVPFQLVLDDREAGVIGFRGSRKAGGQRVVARLEERVSLGHPFESVALGAAAFVEGGRLWAGDAAYGVGTNTIGSVGVGLLAAVPPRSQRMWRLDIARRLTPDAHAARYEVRFTNRDRTRDLLGEAPDITRSRARAVPANLFVWPNGWALQRR